MTLAFIHEIYALLFVLPLISALWCRVMPFAELRDGFNVLLTLFFCVAGCLFLQHYLAGNIPERVELFTILPSVSLALNIEPLGMIFLMVVSILWPISNLYAIGYMRGNKEPYHRAFFSYFALAIFCAVGVAFSANLLTLFIFYELMTLCTYPLVTHNRSDDAKRSGRVYLGVLMGASLALFLPAMLIIWHFTGTLEFSKGGIFAQGVPEPLTGALLLMLMLGVGKVALMPAHKWLPAAMVAPTPVSALLHAVAVVKAGAFSVVKIMVYIVGVDHLKALADANFWQGQWLIYLAGFTIISASVVAIFQDNLKKRLAYSTISQLSYIVLAVAVLSPIAVMAAAFHIAAHAFGKITLFFAAGSIYTAHHKKYVSELSGIGKLMPITMLAFSIGAISMIGIPPAVGFVSKWYIISGAFSYEQYAVIAILIMSTVLNSAYFIPIIYKAFFEPLPEGVDTSRKIQEAPWPMVIPLMLTAIAVVGLCLYPSFFMQLATELTQHLSER